MSIKKDVFYAIIPARSGSTSVKDKNIRNLAGFPLISYSIAAAKIVNEIDRIIVSTDSKHYRDIALSYGAEVPFLRPPGISGPLSTDFEFMKHAIMWFEENEGCVPEYWVHLRPTTPFRDPSLISAAIELIKKNHDATSLRSSHFTNDCPMKWFTIDEHGYYKTIANISFEAANGPRQQFPPTYIPDGYVDIIKSSNILEDNTLHGDRIISFVVPPSIDIDYEQDFINVDKTIEECPVQIRKWLHGNEMIEKEGNAQ